ncbi:MAG: hypothetical protein GJU74_11205 [Metallibacterium scheffleri]|nr:hypothetical protein [Metallibacterium scheffleri]
MVDQRLLLPDDGHDQQGCLAAQRFERDGGGQIGELAQARRPVRMCIAFRIQIDEAQFSRRRRQHQRRTIPLAIRDGGGTVLPQLPVHRHRYARRLQHGVRRGAAPAGCVALERFLVDRQQAGHAVTHPCQGQLIAIHRGPRRGHALARQAEHAQALKHDRHHHHRNGQRHDGFEQGETACTPFHGVSDTARTSL